MAFFFGCHYFFVYVLWQHTFFSSFLLDSRAFSLVFSLSWMLGQGFYCAVLLRDPGVVTPASVADLLERLGDSASSVFYRHCEYCCLPMPARTRHCRRCNRCIAMFDHHCMWINDRCVGQRNYGLFWWMVCMETVVINLSFFVSWHPTDAAWAHIPVELMAAWIALGFLSIFTLILFCTHCYLVATGQTTFELAKWRAITYLPDPQIQNAETFRFPYQFGLWKNAANMCLPSFLCWASRRLPVWRNARKGGGGLLELDGNDAWILGEDDGTAGPVSDGCRATCGSATPLFENRFYACIEC